MATNYVIANSGMDKVINYLNKIQRGTILTVEDFKEIKGLTYTHIRTILVTLCTKHVLIRVCRGVYCYPELRGCAPVFPSVIEVLHKIAENDNYDICPVGEYAKYLLGIRETIPNTILCYNNSKIKTINFKNGISVKILPSKKLFHPLIKNRDLCMLINYINKTGINNISLKDKSKLVNYYNKINITNRNEIKYIPCEIVTYLES